eukprot:scaffold10675_cov121-Isochrysis_galbana.AAC.4
MQAVSHCGTGRIAYRPCSPTTVSSASMDSSTPWRTAASNPGGTRKRMSSSSSSMRDSSAFSSTFSAPRPHTTSA